MVVFETKEDSEAVCKNTGQLIFSFFSHSAL